MFSTVLVYSSLSTQLLGLCLLYLFTFCLHSGQMWNIPFAIAEYTGDRGFLDPNDPAFYMTINNTYPDSSTERTFVAVLQDRSWERTRVPCLYAGNRQAGPIGDIPEDEVPNESVIEGEYTDYIVTSEYASDCTYCKMFSQDMCLL